MLGQFCFSPPPLTSACPSPQALWSRALGAGNEEEAKRKATHALIYGFVFGSIFAGLVWCNLGALVTLLGATGETHVLAVHYLQIIVPSLPFLMIGMVGGAILRVHGDAKRAMMATIYGGAVNAVLDPILIFGLDLELTGAALASVAARLTVAAVSLSPIIKHYGGFVKPETRDLMIDLRPVFALAFPAILTQLATPIGQAYVTRAMAEYGEAAVAGMAIVGRLTPIAFGVIFALSGAVGPIIGQNFGAGQHDRVRGGFKAGIIFVGLFVVFMTILLFFLRAPIADLFAADGITRELVYLFCGPLALFFFNGLLFVANASFNNLGHPYYSTWLNWGRHTVGTIPLVILGALWFGAPGVLIGQAVGGVIFGTLSVVLAWRVMNKVETEATAVPEQVPFAREARHLHQTTWKR